MLSNEISLGSIPPATTGASGSFVGEFNLCAPGLSTPGLATGLVVA